MNLEKKLKEFYEQSKNIKQLYDLSESEMYLILAQTELLFNTYHLAYSLQLKLLKGMTAYFEMVNDLHKDDKNVSDKTD
jgi:hypothetical protein